MNQSFSIIVAADEGLGIGKNGALPWHLPGDMAYYKRTTTEAPVGKRNAVIMGRKTFESIPLKFRPLKHRLNIVLSRQPGYAPSGVEVVESLDAALALVDRAPDVARVFVIGGGALYREALQHQRCREVLLTRVHARFQCDTTLAPFEHAFEKVNSDGPHADGGISYTFETYTRRSGAGPVR